MKFALASRCWSGAEMGSAENSIKRNPYRLLSRSVCSSARPLGEERSACSAQDGVARPREKLKFNRSAVLSRGPSGGIGHRLPDTTIAPDSGALVNQGPRTCVAARAFSQECSDRLLTAVVTAETVYAVGLGGYFRPSVLFAVGVRIGSSAGRSCL